MADPFVAEVRIWACNFAPRLWAFCAGQILPIQQYTALFALIGTYYGGNGTTTFALPNFQGRVPVDAGTGPGLSTYVVGEMTGVQTGLGAIIMEARQLSRTEIIISGMIIIGVAGFLSDRMVMWLGKSLLRWSPNFV